MAWMAWMARVRRWAAFWLATAVVFGPGIAQACAVCTAGREDENANAFIAMTALMTVMPFLVVGGIVFWLVRKARQMAAEEAALAPLTPSPADRVQPLPAGSTPARVVSVES